MNADTADDLKQFIAALISQQHASLREEIHEDLRKDLVGLRGELQQALQETEDRLGQRIDDLAASVAAAMDSSNEDIDARFNDHDRRLTALEQKTA